MIRQLQRIAGGAAMMGVWLIASVALASAAPPKMPDKPIAPGNKPEATETSSAAGAAPPPAKATSTYQTVPNEQLGLGCSSTE